MDKCLSRQGESQSGSIQFGVCGAAKAAADVAAGQEALENRDPSPGDLLYRLPESRTPSLNSACFDERRRKA